MNPLVVALDRSDRGEILRLAEALRGSVGMLKIGLQAFVANGPGLVRELVELGHEVFLDLKFHDIPNTASHAVTEASSLGVALTNVHAAGGRAMLEACARAIPGDSNTRLLAVTMLTSLGEDDIVAIGLHGSPADNVRRLALLTKSCGLHGVVASPDEIELIREECGDDFVILTPGIRGIADATGDQKRTTSAAEAIRRGASFIVVGRPITEAADPRATALRLLESIDAR